MSKNALKCVGPVLLWFLLIPAVYAQVPLQAVLKMPPRLNEARLKSPENARAAITISSLKNAFLTHGRHDTLRVQWSESQRVCRLRYSTKPGAGIAANYPGSFPETGRGELSVTGFPSLDIGIYYCILQDVDNAEATSIEFVAIVQPETPVHMLSPSSTIRSEQDEPVFRWEPITGVPYYFVLLSQGKLEIRTDPVTGDLESVVGVNIIWQAFTDKASIRYGESDLSGVWPPENVAPLVPGETYNWLVFSAFAPALQWIAYELYPLAPSEFTVTRPQLADSPELIVPSEGQNILSDEISFKWRRVPAAKRYHVILNEQIKREDSEGTILLWHHVTLDTEAVFYAKDFLSQKDYHVQILAESQGKTSTSGVRHFKYGSLAGYFEVNCRDAASDAPIPLVELQLRHDTGTHLPFPFFTNVNGVFGLDLAVGAYRIRGVARGYLPGETQFAVPFADTARVVLPLRAAPILIQGHVVQSDGSPVPFSRIGYLDNGARMERKADGQGNFAIGVQTLPAELQISALGYRSQSLSGLHLTQAGVADVGEVVLAEATASLKGTLLDVTGLPMSGVRFFLNGPGQSFEIVQGTGGRFEFKLQEGSWRIRPSLEGFYSEPDEYVLDLAPGSMRQAPFLFFGAALLQGRIFANDRLLSGSEVELEAIGSERRYQAVTDGFGMFRFDVPSGTYTLRIQHPGFASYQTSVNLTEGHVTSLDVPLQQGSVIWGMVQNAESKSPLAGATIVETTTGTILAQSNGDGIFSFPAEPQQTYSVDAQLTGFVSAGPRTASVGSGDSARVDLLLSPASAVIRGIVRDANGPVVDAMVTLLETNATTHTDSSGRFEFSVQPGTYRVIAQKECAASAEQSVTVALGETQEISLQLFGSGAIVLGHVYDQLGQPLFDASILAAGEKTVSAKSDSSGAYRLCLETGAYFVLVTRVGYLSADTTFFVTEGDSIAGLDFYLQDNTAQIIGRTRTGDGTPVAEVQVILTNAWQQMVTHSDAAGNFQFSGIYPGEVTLITRAQLYFAPPLTLTLEGQETRQVDIRMFRSDGFISGLVYNAYNGDGIDSALVIAQVKGSSTFYSAYSQRPDGAYRIDNLPNIPGSTFRVFASKSGYMLPAPRDSIPANSRDVDFGLLATNATISGVVRSADLQEPIADAEIVVSRRGESTRIARSAADGSFIVPGLVFSHAYQVAVRHDHFYSDSLSVEAPAAGLAFVLRRKFALVRGSVLRQTDSTAFADAEVAFANIDGIGRSDTTRTDSAGRFLANIWPGRYQVGVRAPLYFANPPQVLLNLAPGDTSDNLVFFLEKQILASLTIQGPTEIANDGAPVQYTASAIDTSGRNISALPSLSWWVDVGTDTAAIDSSGRLNITRAYVGPLAVGARDTASGISDTLQVEVAAAIDSLSDITLFGRFGQQLQIVPGTVGNSTAIAFEITEPTPIQKVEKAFRVLEPLYRLPPDNLEFDREARLGLPLQEAAGGAKLAVLRWDNVVNAWQVEEEGGRTVLEDGRLWRPIDKGGSYAIVEFSEALSIRSLALQPNPFSPQQINEFGEPGIAIRFSITSNQAALPLVTAKIYNLEGNLVITLAKQKPLPKGPQHLSWNGRTGTGQRARNGRYVLHFRVEDGKDAREELKSIVLIE